MNLNCPLCNSLAPLFFVDTQNSYDYYHCKVCDLRFLNPKLRLNPNIEKLRYQEHNNDINDPRYQNFVRPLFDVITSKKDPPSSGLDFGCGEGPVLAKMLQESGYSVQLYDHYFYPDKNWVNKSYDFVVASEVLEHLYHPYTELKRIKGCLKPQGIFAMMTLIYCDSIDFETWYYRKDPTHVCFYSQKSFQWIKNQLLYKDLVIHSNRVIHFTN